MAYRRDAEKARERCEVLSDVIAKRTKRLAEARRKPVEVAVYQSDEAGVIRRISHAIVNPDDTPHYIPFAVETGGTYYIAAIERET
jgi:hypothetical protein